MSPVSNKVILVALVVALVCVTAPSFAEAASGKRMHALAHRTAAHMSTAAAAESTTAVAAKGDAGGEFGPCKTCVFVLERIKKGTNMLLPSICTELYTQFPTAYAMCHQVLNALSLNGNNVRYWLFEGCYKYEIYQAKEWVKPCPSHIMCSVLKELGGSPFCKPMPMEDPFAFSGESAAASG